MPMKILIAVDLQHPLDQQEALALAEALSEANAQVSLMSLSPIFLEKPLTLPRRVDLYQPFTGSWAGTLRGLPSLLFDLRPQIVQVLVAEKMSRLVPTQMVVAVMEALRLQFRLFASVSHSTPFWAEPLLRQAYALLVPTRLLHHQFSSERSLPSYMIPSFLFRGPLTGRDSAERRRQIVIPGSPSDHENFEGLISELGYALSQSPSYEICLLDEKAEIVNRRRLDLIRRLRALGIEGRTHILSGAGFEERQKVIEHAELICLAPLLLSSPLLPRYTGLALRSRTPLMLNNLQAEMDYYRWPMNSKFTSPRQNGALSQTLDRLLKTSNIFEEWEKVRQSCSEHTQDPANELMRIYSEAIPNLPLRNPN